MNDIVSMHVAKSTLSRLVKRAAAGETVYIGAYGRVEAKLVPPDEEPRARRRFGVLRGTFVLPDELGGLHPDSEQSAAG